MRQGPFLAIVLISCLSVPFLGMQGWLHVRKAAVRKQVKCQLIAGIDKEELVLLRFSKEKAAQLEWEHSKEFEYRGDMYDVVESRTEGDSISYWCWHDNEETELNRQLAQLVLKAMRQDPQHQDGQQRLNQFLTTLYFSHAEQTLPVSDREQRTFPLAYADNFRSWYSEPVSPPPQFG